MMEKIEEIMRLYTKMIRRPLLLSQTLSKLTCNLLKFIVLLLDNLHLYCISIRSIFHFL
ncbi:hypothetical protein HanIR_Chr15g0734051 [Helianthus annuus]|nr:hypothetical protein HanIR_Chr15g0734051 [Helianthus annuus]